MAADPDEQTRRPTGSTVKYNPHLWSDEELRDIFVVRQAQLDELLERMRSTPANAVPQATLFVGARGMGKTTLLRRLALAVREDAGLSRTWLPLSFPEEQYTVSGLGELWRNVLDSLIDALERGNESRADIAELDRQAQELAAADPQEQAARALALISDWCQRDKRRLLLLIDSTDLLLEGLKRNARAPAGKSARRASVKAAQAVVAQGDDSTLWQLRQTLLGTRHMMWVGATYQSLESHHAYDQAFHDFFDLVELRPLSLDDMRQALTALAGRFGMRGADTPDGAAQSMRDQLAARPERLLALRAITGGNPRTTAILYDLFSAGADGDLHSDLRGLLDLMTPLYKARMEQLPEQPRKVLAHVMEVWDPIALRDLAQVSGIAASTVSSQLVRLEQDGLVQKTPLRATSRSGYQVTERFFNIWFLMRHAPRRVRQRLTWLVEFMRLWYRADELEGIAVHRIDLYRQGAAVPVRQAEFWRAVARAMPLDHALRRQLDYQVFRQAQEEAAAANRRIGDLCPELFDLQGDDRPYLTGEQCHQRFCEVRSQLLAIPAERGVDLARWVHRVLGAVHARLEDKCRLAAATGLLTAEQALRKEMFPRLEQRRQLIEAAFDKTAVEAVSEAIAAGRLIPECAGLDLYRAQMADALGNDKAAARLALVLFLLDADKAGMLQAAEALQHDMQPSVGLLVLLGLGLRRFDPTAAESAYRAAIACDGANATAWNALGELLHFDLQRYDEAEAAYLKAIDLDGAYALRWNNLGNLLQYRLQRYQEAEAAYRKATVLDARYALPWNNLGNLLQYRLQRYDEAEAAYRQAMALDATYALPHSGLGNLLQYRLQRDDEAEAAYRKAASLDRNDALPWNNLGNLLQGRLQRYEDAETAYRTAIKLDPNDALPWNNLGNLLQDRLKRPEAAALAYEEAKKIEPNDPYPWVNHGRLLAESGRRDAAAIQFRRALDVLSRRPSEGLGDDWKLLLQAHLWLGNTDLALQALEALARAASGGNRKAFADFREQAYDCHKMGVGPALADLMQRSECADFLMPFQLALRAAAAGSDEQMLEAAVEVQAMARVVLRDLVDPAPAKPADDARR